MKYLSLFSGIDAASVAWLPLGWECVGVSEIDAFACAVLAHHFSGVPNLGDATKLSLEAGITDVVVGGSPCQSFSIAGKRLGLDDPRGNLALEYLRLVRESRTPWMVYENVPGLLSSEGGDDFAAFLSAASGWRIDVPSCGWKNSGVIPQRTATDYGLAYRVLDAQYLGVPQRRRRVFVVGYLGDWRRAVAVLFERHSLSGDPPPGREAGASVARRIATGTNPQRYDGESETFVTHTLRADGFDASEDGTGRGTPLVAVPFIVNAAESCATQSHARQSEVARCIDSTGSFANAQGGTVVMQPTPIDMRQASRGATMTNNRREGSTGGAPGTGIGEPGDPSPSLSLSHPPAVVTSFAEVAQPIRGNIYNNSDPGMEARMHVQHGSAVRRLTPVECERLQGFPDNFTLVPYRGKLAADGNRYKAIGNSFAIPVVRWIGERIQMVDDIVRRVNP